MIGDRLREVRQSQQRSLSEIADKAGISVATLSRIETNKQTLDVGLMLVLAKLLKTAATDLLSNGNGEDDEYQTQLASRIATLSGPERARLWRDLAAARRTTRSTRRAAGDLGNEVEELAAQVDYLREEIEVVRKRLRQRRA